MSDEIVNDYVRPPSRPSVLHINRQLTDKIVAIVFVISFSLWIVAAIYGAAVPIESSSKLPSAEFDTARIFILIGFILLCAVSTLIVFIALRWIPHITSVVLWTFWLPVPSFIAGAIFQPSFWTIYSAIGSILGCGLILILLKMHWFHLSEAVLKEACKMITSVPSTFVFALFTYLVNALVIAITSAAIIKLLVTGTALSLLLVAINCLFGVWTFFTIAAISWMTLSGTFAEYYNAENKGSISVGTVLDSFKVIYSHHVGTAALCNPFLGGLVVLWYVSVLGFFLFFVEDEEPNKTLIFFTVLYNIFDPVIPRVLLLGGATSCSIHGDSFYSSLGNAINLLDKEFITVVKVMEVLTGLSSTLVLFVTILSTYGYVNGSFINELTSQQTLFIYIVLLGGMVFVATLLACLTAAIYTIMLCMDSENSVSGTAAARADSCPMNFNLQAALNHDGAPSWFRNYCCSCIPDIEFEYTQE